MRSEKFVAGADQEVAIERAHIDRSVGRVVHGVDISQRPGCVRQAHYFLHRVDRTNRIRGIADRYQPGTIVDLARQVVHVERAVSLADRDALNGDAPFLERLPGREVGIVIEQRQHDLVARPQFPADGAAHRKGERGHVEAEHYFIGVAAEEVRHGRARASNDSIRALAGEVGSAGVCVRVLQVVGDRIDDALGNLGSARAVEIGGGVAVHLFGKRRELCADPWKIECGRNVVLCNGHNFSAAPKGAMIEGLLWHA